jgi:hypothetical protein
MSTSITTVIDDLIANADFEETRSVSKAQAFVTAATRYIILTPQSQSDQGSSLAMPMAQIENLMARARSYIAASDGSRVRFLSASEGFKR